MAAMLALGGTAWAQPPATQLPVLRPGSTPINAIVGTPTVGANPVLNITQTPSASNRALVEWSSFSIGAKAKVDIVQPNTQSILVNRVVGTGQGGPAASEIYGAMSSNGRVFLINPSGIVFGPGAQVNTGALVASTLDMADSMKANNYAGFLAGGDVELAGGAGAIQVAPTTDIQVGEGGSILLVSRDRLGQGGRLAAGTGGNIELATAEQATVALSNSGYVTLQIGQPAAGGAEVTLGQGSTTQADAGRVRIDAGPQGAVTVADGASVSTDANAAGAKGGSIDVQARRIDIVGNAGQARLSADGMAGGGSITVGGADTRSLNIGAGATLSADATERGDGGSVSAKAMYLDHAGQVARENFGVAEVYGHINARGGAAGGNGGKVETSGMALNTQLATAGDTREAVVDARARAAGGQAGEWTLDPFNVTISNATQNAVDGSFNPTASGATVNVAQLNAALNAGTSVTISTDNPAGSEAGTILVASNSAISRTTPGVATSLTLRANDGITFDPQSSISANSTSPLNINLFGNIDGVGGGGISLTGATLNSGGGNITLNGAANAGTAGAGVVANNSTISGHDVSIVGRADHGFAVSLNNSTINTDSGLVELRGVATRSNTNAGTLTAQGVHIDALQVNLNTGSLVIAGRGDGTINNQDAIGVRLVALGINTATTTTGKIDIVGESVGSAQPGLDINDINRTGILLGAGSSSAILSMAGVALGAISSSGLAMQLGGASNVNTSNAINLRPAGVDANGAITEKPTTPITIGSPQVNTGFVINPFYLGGESGFQPGGGFVIGSSLQTGAINLLAGSLTATDHSALQLTLQNEGAGSAGITLGANNTLGDLALLTTGSVSQGGTLVVNRGLVIRGGAASQINLDGAGNEIGSLSFDPPDVLNVRTNGALVVGPGSASGYDASAKTFTALAITDSVGGNLAVLQSDTGGVVLNSSISMSGTGATVLNIVSPTQVTVGTGVTLGSASPTGRWRIFSPTVVGLAPAVARTNYYGCTFALANGFACSSSAVLATPGNQVIRPTSPTITVAATPTTQPAGTPLQLPYTVAGLQNGDVQATAVTGTLSAPVTNASPPGTYAINQGTLTSPTGYTILFQPAALTLTPGAASTFGIRALQSDFQAELRSDVYGRNLAQPYVCTAASLLRGDTDSARGDPLATEWGKVRNQPQLSGCLDVTDGGQCSAF
jgi:filamentous hemagglutinin family protein